MSLPPPDSIALDVFGLLGLRRPAWHADAACAEHELNLFFPSKNAKDDAPEVLAALKVCAGCLVRTECYDDAIANGDLGIRGGTTERQRRLVTSRRDPRAEIRADVRRLVASGVPVEEAAARLGVPVAAARRWVAEQAA